MGVILKLWMDVILLLTLQRDRRPAGCPDGHGGRFNGFRDEASRHSEQ